MQAPNYDKSIVITCIIFIFYPILLAQQDSTKLNLHVASPDWEDQVIYFLMTDRFNDGDPANNDQGYGEYDPAVSEKYSGGDIQGVIDKLSYIQNLGATAVWITPPVANQWWDGSNKFSGYHGYWAENFKDVDKHVGTIIDYQQLSHHLHQRGMYLIQDIVINHTGNFYIHRDNKFNPKNPAENFEINQESLPMKAPSQYPFNLNNAKDPEHLVAGIYHWTPPILDYNDPFQLVHYELGALDDINTQNVVVREVFRDTYGYWIRVVGVDGFRIDTVIYVEKDFWHDFMHNQSDNTPGIHKVAKTTGRENFITFGETFINSKPHSDLGDIEVASYMGITEKPALNSMLNFPLYFTMSRVFAQGKPTSYLGYRLNTICNSGIYKNPNQLANFIDNHDTNRFLQNSTKAGFQQALFFQFTIPGIPVIYMGTEQMFHESRASMFAGGWGSHGKDHFDETSEMYLFLQKMADVRKKSKVLTRGDLTLLQDSDLGPGVLAFSRKYRDQEAIVLFNTADEKILLNNLETGLPPGTTMKLIHGYNFGSDLECGLNGWVTVELPERSAGLFLVDQTNRAAVPENLNAFLTTNISGKKFSDDLSLKGKIENTDEPHYLVIDGKLKNAILLTPSMVGTWEVVVPVSRFPFGKSDHTLTIYAPEQKATTPPIVFSTELEIQGDRVSIQDAENDDNGPAGNYIKPGDDSYGRQMDILNVEATAFGANLRLELTMAELSKVWLPPNGFDHVLFHVFVDLPHTEGSDYIPMLNSKTPEGFKWDYTAYVAGWQVAYYSSEGATKEVYGKKLSMAPTISVDENNKKVILQFSPDAFGNPETLKGAKIYITTWDCNGGEGGYRAMTETGEPWKFGGANSTNPARIMDDTDVIVIN